MCSHVILSQNENVYYKKRTKFHHVILVSSSSYPRLKHLKCFFFVSFLVSCLKNENVYFIVVLAVVVVVAVIIIIVAYLKIQGSP